MRKICKNTVTSLKINFLSCCMNIFLYFLQSTSLCYASLHRYKRTNMCLFMRKKWAMRHCIDINVRICVFFLQFNIYTDAIHFLKGTYLSHVLVCLLLCASGAITHKNTHVGELSSVKHIYTVSMSFI